MCNSKRILLMGHTLKLSKNKPNRYASQHNIRSAILQAAHWSRLEAFGSFLSSNSSPNPSVPTSDQAPLTSPSSGESSLIFLHCPSPDCHHFWLRLPVCTPPWSGRRDTWRRSWGIECEVRRERGSKVASGDHPEQLRKWCHRRGNKRGALRRAWEHSRLGRREKGGMGRGAERETERNTRSPRWHGTRLQTLQLWEPSDAL